jgi:translation elongation factor EF-Ts
MHNAAMKAAYVKESDVPKNVIEEILASEGGKKALKKFIKRDVLYE